MNVVESAILEAWLKSSHGKIYEYDAIPTIHGQNTPDFFVKDLDILVEIKTFDEQAWREKCGASRTLEKTFKHGAESLPDKDLWIQVGPSQLIATREDKKELKKDIKECVDYLKIQQKISLNDGESVKAEKTGVNDVGILCMFLKGTGKVKFMTFPTHFGAGYRTDELIDFLTQGKRNPKHKSFLSQANLQLGWINSKYSPQKKVVLIAAGSILLDPDMTELINVIRTYCANKQLKHIDEVWLLYNGRVTNIYNKSNGSFHTGPTSYCSN